MPLPSTVNALVAHSGGPTPVINASLLGVVEETRLRLPVSKLYGARFGIPGILKEDFVDLLAQPPEVLQGISRAPASALGSSRHEVSSADLDRFIEVCRSHNIHYFFYTGGNGSMGTALQIKEAAERNRLPLKIAGIPKTIDNDLLVTDHTPGYASTARFFAYAARDIGADIRSLPNQVEILEVLGRNVGWLAAATDLAKSNPDDAPHLIYFPENPLALEKLLDDIFAVYSRLKQCVVVVCEGQLNERGEPFGADIRSGSRGSLAQNLGHRLATLVTSRLKVRARSEKPGLLGRSSSAYISPVDWNEARSCGIHAVRALAEGHSGVMVIIQRQGGEEYAASFAAAPLEAVAFAERTFPQEWMNSEKNGVVPAFRKYVAPLIGPVEPLAHLTPTDVH